VINHILACGVGVVVYKAEVIGSIVRGLELQADAGTEVIVLACGGECIAGIVKLQDDIGGGCGRNEGFNEIEGARDGLE